MASCTEVVTCWQCPDYVNIFPGIMASINNLLRKKKKADEDNIIMKIIKNENSEMTDKNISNNIFEYAVMMSYVNKSTHKVHFIYKINLELNEDVGCNRCGKTIVPFDCSTYDVNPGIRYVDIGTFEELAK